MVTELVELEVSHLQGGSMLTFEIATQQVLWQADGVTSGCLCTRCSQRGGTPPTSQRAWRKSVISLASRPSLSREVRNETSYMNTFRSSPESTCFKRWTVLYAKYSTWVHLLAKRQIQKCLPYSTLILWSWTNEPIWIILQDLFRISEETQYVSITKFGWLMLFTWIAIIIIRYTQIHCVGKMKIIFFK